jgi:hypothetical protein
MLLLHYIRLERIRGDKHFSLLGPIMSYEENELLRIRDLESYSQHFIFFITYKWAKKARVLHSVRLERITSDKRSSLLGPFVSYEENNVL